MAEPFCFGYAKRPYTMALTSNVRFRTVRGDGATRDLACRHMCGSVLKECCPLGYNFTTSRTFNF